MLRKVALAVASMWRDALGVEAEPEYQEYRSFLASGTQRDRWDVLSHGWNADYPDAGNFLGIFATQSPHNDSRLSDSAFDRLLAAAGSDAGDGSRLATLASAEQRLLDS